jgi:hypothetical protein
MIASTLEKVRMLRAEAPHLHIEVDGGIDPLTLPLAQSAGANVFVVGEHVHKTAHRTCFVEDAFPKTGVAGLESLERLTNGAAFHRDFRFPSSERSELGWDADLY